MTVAYVILHYLAGKDTMECAASILEATAASAHKTHIVIVDNGSTNGSYAEICAVYAEHPQVTLLHSDENLGFARGNNLGFRYAKYDLKADFIVMLNNDTILSQKDFNEVLVRKFEETGYGVLGPDIVTADGYHQNPGSKQSWSLKELWVDRMKKRVRIALSYMCLDAVISQAITSVKEVYRAEKLEEEVYHTILHGACFVFSTAYIEQFDGLHDETFLYMEEDILKLYADHYGFLMLYTPELSVFHKEDAATNMVSGSMDKKARRKYRRLIESSQIYSRLKRSFLDTNSI